MSRAIQVETSVVDAERGLWIVRVAGTVDLATADPFQQELRRVAESASASRIVLDLKGVDLMTSAGWGAIISLMNNLRRRGGAVRLAGMSSALQRIYELMSLDEFFGAFSDSAAAIREAWPPSPPAG